MAVDVNLNNGAMLGWKMLVWIRIEVIFIGQKSWGKTASDWNVQGRMIEPRLALLVDNFCNLTWQEERATPTNCILCEFSLNPTLNLTKFHSNMSEVRRGLLDLFLHYLSSTHTLSSQFLPPSLLLDSFRTHSYHYHNYSSINLKLDVSKHWRVWALCSFKHQNPIEILIILVPKAANYISNLDPGV